MKQGESEVCRSRSRRGVGVALTLAAALAWSDPSSAQAPVPVPGSRDRAAKAHVETTMASAASDYKGAEAQLLGTVKACGDLCSDPVLASIWIYVGVVRAERGWEEGAAEAFEAALQLDPGARPEPRFASVGARGVFWGVRQRLAPSASPANTVEAPESVPIAPSPVQEAALAQPPAPVPSTPSGSATPPLPSEPGAPPAPPVPTSAAPAMSTPTHTPTSVGQCNPPCSTDLVCSAEGTCVSPASYWNGAMNGGMIVYYGGYVVVLIGGIVAGASEGSTGGVGLTVFGLQVASAGSTIATAGFAGAHRQAIREGYSPSPRYKKMATGLTAVSTSMLVGGFLTGVAAVSAEDPDVGLALGSLGLTVGSGLLAAINVHGPLNRWGGELARARSSGKTQSSWNVGPTVSSPPTDLSHRHARFQPGLVISGHF